MSNLNVSQGPKWNVNPTYKPPSTTQVNPLHQQPSSHRLSSSDLGALSRSSSQSNPVSNPIGPENVQKMEDGLSDVSPQKILQNSTDVPPPSGLQSQHVQVQDAQPQVQHPPVQTPELTNGDKTLLTTTTKSSALTKQQIPLESLLADTISKQEKDLTNCLPHQKSGILKKATENVKNMIAQAPSNSDVLLHLATKSDSEITVDSIKSLGILKDKYGAKLTPIVSQFELDLAKFKKNTAIRSELVEIRSGFQDAKDIEGNKLLAEKYAAKLKELDPPQDINFPLNTITNKPSFQPDLPKKPIEPVLDTDKMISDIQLSPKKAALLQAMITGITEGRDLAANKIVSYMDDPSPSGHEKKIPNEFTMNGKTYEFVKLLAEGGGGTVFTYKDTQSNEEVVLKKSNDVPLTDEAINHHYINSGNVTAMKGALRMETGDVLIVMEKASGDGQNLMDKLAKTQLSDSDKEKVMISMMSDVFKGMAHIHQQKASHNDVKVGNVYIDSEGTAKVADPGEMKVNDHLVSSRFGTALFNSPEVNEDGKVADRQKNDIWSAGAMLYKMYTGNIPFDHPNLKDISRDNATLQSNIDFGKDPNNRMFTQHPITSVQEVINSMMHPDPAQRPSFESLSKMSFFQNIDPQIKSKIGQIMTTPGDQLDQIN